MIQKRSRLSRSGTYVAPEGWNKVKSLSPGVRELTALGSLSKKWPSSSISNSKLSCHDLGGGGGGRMAFLHSLGTNWLNLAYMVHRQVCQDRAVPPYILYGVFTEVLF